MFDLITDRERSDVDNDTAKGSYNYTDLNRVESAVQELAGLLADQGYPVTLDFKTDWTRTDFPTESQMVRYLENVKKCVSQYTKIPGSTTLPESMQDINWQKANTIEQTLMDLQLLTNNMKSTYRYSGTFYAGHSGLRGYCL